MSTIDHSVIACSVFTALGRIHYSHFPEGKLRHYSEPQISQPVNESQDLSSSLHFYLELSDSLHDYKPPLPLFVPVSGCLLPLLLSPPTSFSLINIFRTAPQDTRCPKSAALSRLVPFMSPRLGKLKGSFKTVCPLVQQVVPKQRRKGNLLPPSGGDDPDWTLDQKNKTTI